MLVIEEAYNALFLFSTSHAKRHVDIAGEVISQITDKVEIQVAGRRNFKHPRIQRDHLPSRSHVPHRSGINYPDLIAQAF